MTTSALDRFIAERQRLTALAYRMLGERSAAEDVVQEVWLRWSRAAEQGVANPGAWLHRVTTRLALDALRSARWRREVYVGPWLPEPLVAEFEDSSEDAFALAQECRLALLWAMERLSPEERAAFILRRVFDTDYSELADILDKTEVACRQLVSRAARKVKSAQPSFKPDTKEIQQMLLRFSQAAVAQDHKAVLSLLSPDVVSISDGGGRVRAALRPLVGAEEVAQVILAVAAGKVSRSQDVRIVDANGTPALAVLSGSNDDMLFTLTINENGLIEWIYMMRNPEKLPVTRSPKPGDKHPI